VRVNRTYERNPVLNAQFAETAALIRRGVPEPGGAGNRKLYLGA